MKPYCPDLLSPALLLVALGTVPALSAQQNQGYPKHFPAYPIGTQSGGAPATQTEMEPMPLVAPIFIEDATTSSSLVIVNSTAINAGATIVVRSLSGSEVGTVHKKLAPHEQQDISLQSLLAGFASPIGIGSIAVTQDASLKGMAIASQLLITKFKASLPSYVDEELAMPRVGGSATLRGVANDALGTALLAITSIVNWEQHVTVRCLAQQAELKPAVVTLAPYATSLVSSCSGQTVADLGTYTQGTNQRQGSSVQGYELVTDGGPAAITAFGLAPHLRNQELVWSGVPFTDPAEIHSPNSVFAGVPFGAQDALPNGVYKPRISFTNFAATPAHITVSIAATLPGDVPFSAAAGESPEKVTIRQLTVAPRRSVELALSDAVSQSGLLQSLFVESDKKPGEVLGKAISRSDGNLFEVELLEKDQLDEENGGIHPWSVEGDSESHLLLFNYSKKPQVFGVGISNGVILWDRKYTLAPNETREISINELIQDKVRDGKGRILTSDQQRGVVNWMVPDFGEGTGRLMVTSRSRGMARNFSCGNFTVVCGMDFYLYNDGILPVDTTDVIWDAQPEFCSAWGPGQCSGGNAEGSGSASYSWTIGAASIITPTSSTSQSPSVTGVSHGSGSGSVEAEAEGCGSQGTGPATVPACPSTIAVGKTTPYALSSFSQDVPNLISTGIGIVATMTVGPASPSPNGALLTESLNTLEDTCPQTSPWPTKTAACTGVSPTFTIGTGGTATADGGAIVLGTFPPVANTFYDEHTLTNFLNLLANSKISSCTIVCNQTYSCGGSPVSSFTITYDLLPGTVGSNAVSNVSVTKY